MSQLLNRMFTVTIQIILKKDSLQIQQLKSIVHFGTLKLIYKVIVEGLLNYVIVIWGSASNTHLQQLVVTQKWVSKIMLGNCTIPS